MRVVIAIVAVLLLGGCGNALSEREAREVLLAHQQDRCPPVFVFEAPKTMLGSAGVSPIGAQLRGWVQRNLEGSDSFQVSELTPQRGMMSIRRTFYYKAADKSWLQVEFDDHLSMGGQMTRRDLYRAVGCFQRPTAIKVLDITVDQATKKQATVIFEQTVEPTAMGRALEESGIDYAIVLGLPGASYEYRGSLERLDKKGWRVANVEKRGVAR